MHMHSHLIILSIFGSNITQFFAIYYYMMFFSYHVVTYKGIKMTDRWFSPGTPVCSTNITDSNDIIEILLKVALNTINLNH